MCKLCATGYERAGTASAPFYFCFECVVVFGILVYVLMKRTFYKSLKTRGFYSVLNSFFLEQNVQYAQVL